MRYERPVRESFQVSHKRGSPMIKHKHPTFPVSIIKLVPLLAAQVTNPAVQPIDDNTIIIWNSPEHKAIMMKQMRKAAR